MIKLEDIYKSYEKDSYVLKGVSLEVKAGEIYGLVGMNGAGKTTLMNIVAGLLEATRGTCYLQKEGVGYLPDIPAFFTYFTAREYLAFLACGSQLDRIEAHKKIDSLLSLVGLSQHEKKRIRSFSRGMLQRLGIAAILINDPAVILLDEPTSALDPLGRHELLQIIRSLRSEGKAILLSTHILSDMEKVCDRIGFLHNGKIVNSMTPQELLTVSKKHQYTLLVKNRAGELCNRIGKLPFIEKVELISEYKLIITLKQEEKAQAKMLHALADSGIIINSISMHNQDLDSRFMEVIHS